MDRFKQIDKIVKLLLIKRERALTEQEQETLNDWVNESEGNHALYDDLMDEMKIPGKLDDLVQFDQKKAFREFERVAKQTKVRKLYRNAFKYAAILIPFVIASWLIIQQNREVKETPVATVVSEIGPGTSKAILKLADGSVVDLEVKKDLIVDLDGIVVQNGPNEILYSSQETPQKHEEIQYNEIQIPRGGEYLLILSDSTKVWLNSETSIKYPVAFASNVREVYLQNGEAFFDVKKNKNSPFIVHTSKMAINVLGTSFNIRAYSDEPELTTTLITGKVSIKQLDSDQSSNLLPNQQASLSATGIAIKNVDVNKYIAWKNGRILFEDNTLEEIFKDLSRWYDIDVEFKNSASRQLRFSVDVERYENLSQVLDILELTKKADFNIVENTIIIN